MPNPGMVDVTKTNVVRNRRMTLERPKPHHGSATKVPDYCIVKFATVSCSSVYIFLSAMLSFHLCFQGPLHVQPDWQSPWYSSSSSTTCPLIPLHQFAIPRTKRIGFCRSSPNDLVMQETRVNKISPCAPTTVYFLVPLKPDVNTTHEKVWASRGMKWSQGRLEIAYTIVVQIRSHWNMQATGAG